MASPDRQHRAAQIAYPRALPEVIENWRIDALCRTFVDDEVWYPEDPKEAEFGKGVCNGTMGGPVCPVRSQCLAAALARGERYGTFGGMTEWDREEMLDLEFDKHRNRRKKVRRIGSIELDL